MCRAKKYCCLSLAPVENNGLTHKHLFTKNLIFSLPVPACSMTSYYQRIGKKTKNSHDSTGMWKWSDTQSNFELSHLSLSQKKNINLSAVLYIYTWHWIQYTYFLNCCVWTHNYYTLRAQLTQFAELFTVAQGMKSYRIEYHGGGNNYMAPSPSVFSEMEEWKPDPWSAFPGADCIMHAKWRLMQWYKLWHTSRAMHCDFAMIHLGCQPGEKSGLLKHWLVGIHFVSATVCKNRANLFIVIADPSSTCDAIQIHANKNASLVCILTCSWRK